MGERGLAVTDWVKRWPLVLAAAFFGLIILIGLVSGVSLSVAFARGAGWSVTILGLLLVMNRLLAGMLQPLEEAETQGQALDVSLPPEYGDKPDPAGAQVMTGMRQIDQDLEEMVKNNPERVAELTRKMGLE